MFIAPRLKLLFLQRDKFPGEANSTVQNSWEFSGRKVFSCSKYELDRIQMSQVLAWDLALTLCSSSTTYPRTFPLPCLPFHGVLGNSWYPAGFWFPCVTGLVNWQVAHLLYGSYHPAQEASGNFRNCASHLQNSREGKNYIFILYTWGFSYYQRYSGSQIFGAICGEKTLQEMMDFHFPDS